MSVYLSVIEKFSPLTFSTSNCHDNSSVTWKYADLPIVPAEGENSSEDRIKMTKHGKLIEKSNLNSVLNSYLEQEFDTASAVAADPVVQYMSNNDKKKAVERLRVQMIEAAKRMDFIEAAQYRDELLALEQTIKEE